MDRIAPVDKPLCDHNITISETVMTSPYEKETCVGCGRVEYHDRMAGETYTDPWPANPLGLSRFVSPRHHIQGPS